MCWLHVYAETQSKPFSFVPPVLSGASVISVRAKKSLWVERDLVGSYSQSHGRLGYRKETMCWSFILDLLDLVSGKNYLVFSILALECIRMGARKMK